MGLRENENTAEAKSTSLQDFRPLVPLQGWNVVFGYDNIDELEQCRGCYSRD